MTLPKLSLKNIQRRRKRNFKDHLLQFFVIGLNIASSSYLLPQLFVTAYETNPIPTPINIEDINETSVNGN